MMFMLLQVLQPELAGPGDNDDDVPDVTGKIKQPDKESGISVIARRILPALRQYSTWLVSRANIIVNQEGHSALSTHIKEMWSMYCSTLSMLVSTFQVAELLDLATTVPYLLEEDAATVGFKPFRDSELCKLYTDDSGRLKPRTTDPGVSQELPGKENLVRVRDLLLDGMVLAHDESIPVYLINQEFRFGEDGPPIASPISGHAQNHSLIAPPSPLLQEITMAPAVPDTITAERFAAPRAPSITPSDSHQSMSTDMYQMVDSLVSAKNTQQVSANESSYGMNSSTAEVFGAISMQDIRPVSRHQATPLTFAPGPNIWASAFSPQPGELNSSLDQSISAARIASLPLSGRNQQFTAAAAFDRPGGGYMGNSSKAYGLSSSFNSPAAKVASKSPSPTRDGEFVAQYLRKSLETQYGAMPSSEFSHPSSIFASTPQGFQQPNFPYNAVPRIPSHNTSTVYGGSSVFDDESLWRANQSPYAARRLTPPGGQGG
jgi:hypothetical protein